jgi:FixJ family two-component response regulator
VRSSHLIAVVDDDMSLREALAGLLGAYGYRIDSYASGHDLLSCGKLGDYALFILDVQMPGLDGLQVQEAITGAGVAAPVIFLTSSLEADVRRRALAQGAAAFLGKPFQSGDLLARLHGALDRADG